MIKILLTMIFSLSLVVFAQEEAPKPDDKPSVNSAPITEKSNSNFSGDPAYSKTAGVGKPPNKTEADLNPDNKSGCKNCTQPTKDRLTSNKGKLNPTGMTYDQVMEAGKSLNKKTKKAGQNQ